MVVHWRKRLKLFVQAVQRFHDVPFGQSHQQIGIVNPAEGRPRLAILRQHQDGRPGAADQIEVGIERPAQHHIARPQIAPPEIARFAETAG